MVNILRDSVVAAPDSSKPLVFVFGASNVRRGLPSLLEITRRTLGPQWDLIVTAGHGRSYGTLSHVFGRGLPGIRDAQWKKHLTDGVRNKSALFTDIGNDLLYGATPLQIRDWLDECLSLLTQHDVQITIAGLPVEVLKLVGRKKFFILRTFFFPKSDIDFLTALKRIDDLDEYVREAAQRHQTEFVRPSSTWYGVDPIHVMYRHQQAMWRQTLPWLRDKKSPFFIDENELRQICFEQRMNRWMWMMRLFFIRAQQQTWFTLDRSMTQPAVRFDAQRNVWFY